MLTPAEIEQKQFSTVRFKEGYAEEEVDAFLDRIGSDYRYLHDELAAERKQNSELRRLATTEAPTQRIPVADESPSAQRLLELAQKTADEIVAKANVEAHQIKAKAEHAAENVRRQAEAASLDIRRQTEEEVAARLAEVDKQIAEKHRQLSLLDEARRNAANSVRAALESLED